MKHSSLLFFNLFFFLPLLSSVTPILDKEGFLQLTQHSSVCVQVAGEWCGVCKAVKNPFDEISGEEEFTHLSFARVEIDKLAAIAPEINIVGVPTFLFFNQGTLVDSEIGVQDLDMFKDHLKNRIRSTFKLAAADTGTRTDIGSSLPLGTSSSTQDTPIPPANETFWQALQRVLTSLWSSLISLFKTIGQKISDLFNR